jgi:hypothetical protein
MNNEGHKYADLFSLEAWIVNLKEWEDPCMLDLYRKEAIYKELPLIFLAKRKTQREIVAQTADGDKGQLMRESRITSDSSAHYSERPRDQVKGSANRFLEIVSIGYGLAKIGQCSKSVD